jgi:hypothetical protein
VQQLPLIPHTTDQEKIILTREHDLSQLKESINGAADKLFVSLAELFRILQILVTVITAISFVVAGGVYFRSRQTT